MPLLIFVEEEKTIENISKNGIRKFQKKKKNKTSGMYI